MNTGATIDFNGYNQTFFQVSGVGTVALNGGASLTVGGDNSTAVFAGALTGPGSLVKAGTGTLTLTGANTFAGPTTVLGGKLKAGRANVFGNSNLVSLAGGTEIDLNGFSQNIGSLTGTGTLTLGGGAGSLGRFILNGIVGGDVSVAPQGLFRMNGNVNGSVILGSQGVYNLAGVIGGNLNLSGSLTVPAPGSASASFNAKRLNLFAAAATAVPSLVINGNFTTTPGSTLALTVAEGGAPPIVVNAARASWARTSA